MDFSHLTLKLLRIQGENNFGLQKMVYAQADAVQSNSARTGMMKELLQIKNLNPEVLELLKKDKSNTIASRAHLREEVSVEDIHAFAKSRSHPLMAIIALAREDVGDEVLDDLFPEGWPCALAKHMIADGMREDRMLRAINVLIEHDGLSQLTVASRQYLLEKCGENEIFANTLIAHVDALPTDVTSGLMSNKNVSREDAFRILKDVTEIEFKKSTTGTRYEKIARVLLEQLGNRKDLDKEYFNEVVQWTKTAYHGGLNTRNMKYVLDHAKQNLPLSSVTKNPTKLIGHAIETLDLDEALVLFHALPDAYVNWNIYQELFTRPKLSFAQAETLFARRGENTIAARKKLVRKLKNTYRIPLWVCESPELIEELDINNLNDSSFLKLVHVNYGENMIRTILEKINEKDQTGELHWFSLLSLIDEHYPHLVAMIPIKCVANYLDRLNETTIQHLVESFDRFNNNDIDDLRLFNQVLGLNTTLKNLSVTKLFNTVDAVVSQ